ncbi:hypothetical protein [Alienimonas californiensis]|uniref:Uncharacterized protein n=1 Tax=Alienimonas californiensis TaxID=2527989 RepID=A0A517P5M1_9PLAN|nr:hypothetical protein [Alienimonas californiensis]QDT14656.1 hypothetical protein CA12_07330 [Alienimonas californiensis]
MNRLRRRDPEAALQQYSGGWRKAGSPEAAEAVPVLLPHAPARLRDETPAAPVRHRQDAQQPPADPSADDMPAPQPPVGNGLNLDIDLEGLGLDDLGLPGLGLPDNLGLPDDREFDGGPSALYRPIRDVRDPAGIRSILPFADYDPYPDPDDPCRNLCPRPEGCPPQDADGDRVALCPEVAPLSTAPYQPRPVLPVQYRWAAPNITYNPLYFQDVNLERYGHHHGVLQPAASVGKFGVQLIGLPYQMALDPPHKCETPLGYYRPGDCAPKLCYQIPLNAKAALVQAAAVSGVALILP